MESITLAIKTCEETGTLIASWTDPNGLGGLTTQAHHMRELEANILAAIEVHFDPEEQPKRIFLHFEQDHSLPPHETACGSTRFSGLSCRAYLHDPVREVLNRR